MKGTILRIHTIRGLCYFLVEGLSGPVMVCGRACTISGFRISAANWAEHHVAFASLGKVWPICRIWKDYRILQNEFYDTLLGSNCHSHGAHGRQTAKDPAEQIPGPGPSGPATVLPLSSRAF